MSRVIAPFTQFFDGSGDPLANGWLKFLVTESNNSLKDTYADADQTIPNANPLQLDAEGRCPNVFGQGIYRVELYTNNPVTHLPGALIQQFDPVYAEYLIDGAGGNFAEWDSTTAYQVGNIVIYNGDYYRSYTANNQGNQPDTSTDAWERIGFLRYWNMDVTYAIDDVVVYGSNLYFSVQNMNQNNQPDITPAWWSPVGGGTILLFWQESGTTLQPVLSGYDLGSNTNTVGTAWIQDLGMFTETPAALPTTDYQIANKIYVDETAALRMRWIGDWTPATYEINDVVRDDNWTMVAIAQTSDRPAPQPAGDNLWVRDAFSPPAFSETSDSQPALFIGQRYEFTPAFTVRSIRIWLPETSIGDDVEVWMVYNSTTDPRIVNVLPSLTIGADQVEKWVTLTIGSQYVASGSFIDFIMVLRPGTGPLTFTYEWSYVRANGDPSSGQIYHQGGLNADQIRVHEEDSSATDRTADLNNIVAGSKITMDSQDYTWEVLQASKTGDVYTFIVDPGARAGAETSDFTFTYYAATPIYYVYNTDLFLSDARISGYYATEYDPSNATYLNNNGYGIDIEVQNMISSDDWEVVAAPFGTVSGGTGSELVNWEESDTVLRPVVSGAGQLGDATHLIGGAYFGDNAHIYLGDGQDLDIYFGGTNSNVLSRAGKLSLGTTTASNLDFRTNNIIRWRMNSATGHLVPETANTYDIGSTTNEVGDIYIGDGSRVWFGSSQQMNIYHSGGNAGLTNTVGDFNIGNGNTGNLNLKTDGANRWYIDGSTGNLIPSGAYNIGDTSNRVNGIFTDVIDLPDNGVARFGNADDLQIYHDGTNSYIENNTGSFVVQQNVEGQVISFRTNDGVSIINRWYVGPEGDIRPAAPNTYSLGNSTSLIDNIYQGDNGKHYFGSDQDMEISHGGNNGFITNGTGQLIIQNLTGNTNDITFRTNGGNRWAVDGPTGDWIPSIDNTFSIGDPSFRVANIYTVDLESTNMPTVSGVALTTAVFPDQSGHSGEYLTTNGTIVSWATAVDLFKVVSFYYQGGAIVDDWVVPNPVAAAGGGFEFDESVEINAITITAMVAPTGSDLIVDIYKDAVDTGSSATLAADNTIDKTSFGTPIGFTTSNTMGIKISAVGSTEAGQRLNVIVHYKNV